MDQQKKPTQSEDMDREGGQGQQSKQKEEQRLPGQNSQGQRKPGDQDQWKQPGQTGEEKKREDVA
ncbi:MAG TPA: hypothetical protein VJ453_04645 [Terriglobales bacterium]|jgi:hypothetical protein|nr:hypothetical protein [Terriglobales bacterium]